MSVRIVNKEVFDRTYNVENTKTQSVAKAIDNLCYDNGLAFGIGFGGLSLGLTACIISGTLFFKESVALGMFSVVSTLLISLVCGLILMASMDRSFFGRLEQKIIEPVGRKRRRKQLFKKLQAQDRFIKGTVDSDRPLIDYKIIQKITVPCEGEREILLNSNLFQQDPKLGWVVFEEKASSKQIHLNLNDAQWRDQLASAKIQFEEQMDQTCQQSVLSLQQAKEQKTLKQKTDGYDQDIEKMQNEEILHILNQ